jgi:hypothetical protein
MTVIRRTGALGEVVHVGMSADSAHLWTLPMFHRNGSAAWI